MFPKKVDASATQKWRVVIDYGKLNEVTFDEKYRLPNISDILDLLGKCLRSLSGFHLIEIDPKSIQKTEFSVENGDLKFDRIPIVLKKLQYTFHRVIDNIHLVRIQNERVLNYMHD